eukprot:TRINITY_DN9320_c0_g1_i1.p1 TRINITY_DN9320_c0_g1~~TRINITY_DN9320_c0_g1_i1.p1  ORF type:complete len:898 (+),score=96.50 TRINITY_DN9320_c0_g1_i1:1-2694(+)
MGSGVSHNKVVGFATLDQPNRNDDPVGAFVEYLLSLTRTERVGDVLVHIDNPQHNATHKQAVTGEQEEGNVDPLTAEATQVRVSLTSSSVPSPTHTFVILGPSSRSLRNAESQVVEELLAAHPHLATLWRAAMTVIDALLTPYSATNGPTSPTGLVHTRVVFTPQPPQQQPHLHSERTECGLHIDVVPLTMQFSAEPRAFQPVMTTLAKYRPIIAYMCQGASAETLDALLLTELVQGCREPTTKFSSLLSAMETLGISDTEISEVFSVLAGLLHLASTEPAITEESKAKHLHNAGHCLGVDPEALKTLMITRQNHLSNIQTNLGTLSTQLPQNKATPSNNFYDSGTGSEYTGCTPIEDVDSEVLPVLTQFTAYSTLITEIYTGLIDHLISLVNRKLNSGIPRDAFYTCTGRPHASVLQCPSFSPASPIGEYVPADYIILNHASDVLIAAWQKDHRIGDVIHSMHTKEAFDAFYDTRENMSASFLDRIPHLFSDVFYKSNKVQTLARELDEPVAPMDTACLMKTSDLKIVAEMFSGAGSRFSAFEDVVSELELALRQHQCHYVLCLNSESQQRQYRTVRPTNAREQNWLSCFHATQSNIEMTQAKKLDCHTFLVLNWKRLLTPYQNLIEHATHPSATEPRFLPSLLLDVPPEILHYILSFLSSAHLVPVSQVNQYLQQSVMAVFMQRITLSTHKQANTVFRCDNCYDESSNNGAGLHIKHPIGDDWAVCSTCGLEIRVPQNAYRVLTPSPDSPEATEYFVRLLPPAVVQHDRVRDLCAALIPSVPEWKNLQVNAEDGTVYPCDLQDSVSIAAAKQQQHKATPFRPSAIARATVVDEWLGSRFVRFGLDVHKGDWLAVIQRDPFSGYLWCALLPHRQTHKKSYGRYGWVPMCCIAPVAS